MRVRAGRLIMGIAVFLLSSSLSILQAAEEVLVAATHRARYNIDGKLLGQFPAGQSICIKQLEPGRHKLYVRSLLSGEMKLFKFSIIGKEGEKLNFTASFAAVNTAISAGLKLNSSTDSKLNNLVVEMAFSAHVNLDGSGLKLCRAGECLSYRNLSEGIHRLHVRNLQTMELAVYQVEFRSGKANTLSVSPKLKREAEIYRTPGAMAATVAAELFGQGVSTKNQLVFNMGN